MRDEAHALKIHITGVVQGVGFRPFVYGLAIRHELVGWVCNTSAGVDIEVEGSAPVLDSFVAALKTKAPPLARIEEVSAVAIPVDGYTEFVIRHSKAQPGAFQLISPDICTCQDCLRELFDPTDRRYRYPFINCTNCGPRFTIIRDIPYDRPKTTMAPFKMCLDCQAEYKDPLDRRFHAQPNACPVCGPQVELRESGSECCEKKDKAIQTTREMLTEGKIVAIKGLGGFHLACDAANDEAVARLRERKGRVDKPFALMAFDLATVETFCHVDQRERALLVSRERPIVLLRERQGSPISPGVAPGIKDLGVMLPYTPLHYLLLAPGSESSSHWPLALVMTSGNYSEEPIATDNDEALECLSDLADTFLLHNRDIHVRCDDSVTRVAPREDDAELPLRRSRGYAPYPIHLPFETGHILAVGAELKNTFCLAKGRYAFLSQHIGDMENYETLRSFELILDQLCHTFRVEPEIVAYDMHPAYLSTQYALQRARGEEQEAGDGAPEAIAVQHHHAHVASCMVENGLDGSRPVIGVSFDGTGYGTDGAIWGGEFLIADYRDFRRAAHLSYVPLPGGDTAIRKPYRTALAHLWAAGLPWDENLPPVAAASSVERSVIIRQVEQGLNSAPTSSMGRLFDAVAALAGVRQVVNYEAQAAIEFEMLADKAERSAYDWELVTTEQSLQINAGPIIRAVVANVRAGTTVSIISARFHNSVAQMVVQVCQHLRDETGLVEVALSGGVWQNITLLAKTLDGLQASDFTVYTHRVVPPNDGGLALGQAAIANFGAKRDS